jgi:hypothetical protein
MHADGGGLYLRVKKGGSKGWVLQVMVKGQARAIGLGSINHRSLAEARDQASSLIKVAKAGGDPILERDGDDGGDCIPTFEEPPFRSMSSAIDRGRIQSTASNGGTRWRIMSFR